MTQRNIESRSRAKSLRTTTTPPEHLLWAKLRAGRLGGIKFTRQIVVGAHYIADFAARSHRLIIELDGDSHAGQEAYDAARTAFMQSKGFRVIRFTNSEVMTNMDGVLRTILNELGKFEG